MAARLYKRGRIWWTWYYDGRGKRHDVSTRCRDQRAAGAVARRYEREAAGPPDPARHTTLQTACERFGVDRRDRGVSTATISYYATKLSQLCRVLGADTVLVDVTPAAVDRLIGQRLGEGAARATVAKELGALRGVLRLAWRRGEYGQDPAAVLPQGWSSGYVPRRRVLSLAQAQRLIAVLPAYRAAHVAFLLASGSRLGPSFRAQRRDIDLDAGLILVRGTKTPRSWRTVPIWEHTADLARLAWAGAAPVGVAFTSWGNVRRDLTAACARASVPRVSPNDLRRSASTWLVELGAPSHLVAYFLGHTTSRMVETVYGRVDGAALARAFAAVGIAAAELQRTRVV